MWAMNMSSKNVEIIFAGERASIENTRTFGLPISLISDNGSHFEVELMPGQSVTFSAGSADAKVVLHDGDPAGLLIIKPESAS